MTPLQRLETDIVQLHDRISLRPTLEIARQIGEKLLEAKKMLPHGGWTTWLRRTCIAHRTANTYCQIANSPATASFGERLTIEQFLSQFRMARRPARRARKDPDVGKLGTLDIDGSEATLTSEVFRQVSPIDYHRELLVCRSYDDRAKDALSRGIAVLLLPEIQ